MIIADLTTIADAQTGVAVVGIGWVGRGHTYPRGAVEPHVLERVWACSAVPINQTRGVHRCDLCPGRPAPAIQVEREGITRWLGAAELRVFGADGTIYAAPNLLYHYLAAHHYRPPAVFLTALHEGPQPGTAAYAEHLTRYGWL